MSSIRRCGWNLQTDAHTSERRWMLRVATHWNPFRSCCVSIKLTLYVGPVRWRLLELFGRVADSSEKTMNANVFLFHQGEGTQPIFRAAGPMPAGHSAYESILSFEDRSASTAKTFDPYQKRGLEETASTGGESAHGEIDYIVLYKDLIFRFAFSLSTDGNLTKRGCERKCSSSSEGFRK